MFEKFFSNLNKVSYSDFSKQIKTPLDIIHLALQDAKWLQFLGVTLFNLFVTDFIFFQPKNKLDLNKKNLAMNSYSEFLKWIKKIMKIDFMCDEIELNNILICFHQNQFDHFIFQLLQNVNPNHILDVNESKRFICDFIILRKGLYSKPIAKRLKKFMMDSLGIQRKNIFQLDEIFNFICN